MAKVMRRPWQDWWQEFIGALLWGLGARPNPTKEKPPVAMMPTEPEPSTSEATDEQLWAELVRRGAALRVGYCYPAMATAPEATALVHEHGYEFGPFQFLELGHRLAEPPQWVMYAEVPERFRPDPFGASSGPSDSTTQGQ